MTSLYDLDRAGLAAALGPGPRYRVDQAWSGMYEHFRDPTEISTLPRPARDALLTAHPSSLTPVAERVSDDGNTIKMVTQITGGYLLETVLMLYPDRATVCVSSQAGCAMACGFCATGQAGFDRQLTAGEIIEQVVRAARRAKAMDRRVSNIVFMGMGEPMANYDAVWRSVERCRSVRGFC